MSAEHERRDIPLKAAPRGRVSFVPTWYLNLRLRWACNAIFRLERQLGNEFGLLETAPLHEELEALIAERDALLERLRERSN